MSPTAEQVDLLQRSLDHITTHPEEWDQTSWAARTECGTAYCLAGTAVFLAGLTIDWSRSNPDTGRAYLVTDGRHIDTAAEELLGLDEADADTLFAGGNDLEDLWVLATIHARGRIAPPPQYADACADACAARDES